MDNSLRDPRLFSTNNSLRDPALLSYPELISPTILSSSSATENYNIISNEQLHRDIQALHNLEIEKLNTPDTATQEEELPEQQQEEVPRSREVSLPLEQSNDGQQQHQQIIELPTSITPSFPIEVPARNPITSGSPDPVVAAETATNQEEEVEILTNQEEEVEILTNHEHEEEVEVVTDQQDINESPPQTATSLKFPLPAKPPSTSSTTEQKTIPPLFAPSPSQSENQQQTSDHENLNNSNVRSSSSSPILADNLQEQQQNQQPQQPQQPVLSRLASLRQRVEKDPMDGEAWIELINDSVKKGDLEKTREVYESFLKYFPDAANQWISYADLELGHGHFPEVEQIFSRCLRSSVSVELWAFYLNYIRRVNPVEGDKAAASRAIIISAYDFSLNHIGIDRESGQIWLDYINIVKAGEAAGTWQEQQKMDSLRKLYQRAVCIPLDNIEQVWKEYDGFEHQMSKMTAKKFLADKSAQYMMARASLKEMKSLTDPLLRPRVPVKPNWKRINDHKQLDQWKTYLAWEEKNPLEITDKNLLNTRIQYAYRQAIMHMRFYPEIWYLAASHLQKNEKAEEALAVLQSGLTANPTSIVLTYATVEAQEDMKNYAACYEAFNSLIQYYHTEIDEINKTIEKEIAHGIPIIDSKTVANPTLPSTTQVDGETDQQELTEEEKVRAKEEEQLRSNITALYKPKIDEFREAAASVWITEMRFARRTEGIKPARAVFTRARKAQYITSHVFEASAMMEYHWNKEPAVATKVFDLGLKTFSEDVNYVLQYLNFLITLNDDSNARALFEKTISKINPESARPLWRRWAAYEFIYGDKAASEKLNLRVAEIFPDWGVVERLSDRHAYADLGEVIGRELGTCIEPIPLRNRSPSPVPQHLEGYGFKRAGGGGGGMHEHPGGIPSGPASYRNRQHHQHSNQRDRSFSPDVRGKRARGQRSSISPDRRNGPTSTTIGPNNPSNLSGDSGNANKRGRENYENNPKRNRYSSPPNRNNHNNNRAHTPPLDSNSNQNHVANNPYSWFPEGLRYFLSILPLSTSFEGPRLDTSTVLQVLSEVTMPVGNNGGVNNVSNIPHGPSNSSNTSTGRGGGGGVPSGPASRGGNGNGSDNYNNHGNHVIAGWGPNRGGGNNSGSSGRGSHNPTRRGRRK
ncbi:hypothetical protein PSTG_16729 [Puccinia striiformis f. sp. tritici PST-78]|uniref:mRNA 3'-end-processing protein RNA14 n=1 Tax=Puccinia striiformis f. sp. tritici PST-78 TaxID=1165861 RepID=A0A0L0US71_9BASI|nr:hypothetical protein PSTG_16729 [Puccinia striiformis f. sp. tritici PST-78]